MVAFPKEKKKRFVFSESDAIALCQCIDNALEHLGPPDCVADLLIDIGNRLVDSFDLGRCPSCDCVCCGEDCGEEDE